MKKFLYHNFFNLNKKTALQQVQDDFFVPQQDYKPNFVLCDHLSAHSIALRVKRTTFNLFYWWNNNQGFVLAPNKDLAVSAQSFNWNRPNPLRDGRLNLSVSAFLFAPRILRWTAVSRYFFNSLSGRWFSDFPPPHFAESFAGSDHSSCWDIFIIPNQASLSS